MVLIIAGKGLKCISCSVTPQTPTPETKLLIARIYSLELQLSQAEKRENWLKGQIEKAQQEVIQLLEHKPKTQKGLFNRVIGAIRNN